MKPLIGHAGLQWFMDGDATVIVRDDFVDLQASPAVFLECSVCHSTNILTPADLYRKFTCEPCGRVLTPDLSQLGYSAAKVIGKDKL